MAEVLQQVPSGHELGHNVEGRFSGTHPQQLQQGHKLSSQTSAAVREAKEEKESQCRREVLGYTPPTAATGTQAVTNIRSCHVSKGGERVTM